MNGARFVILDNSNIVESYPGITLPLTCSFIKIAYKGVFKEFVRASVKNDAIVAQYNGVFDNMIRSYKGRIYYCINNWYSLINLMPFSKKIIPVWQDMMGVQNRELYLDEQHAFTLRQKTTMYWNMARNGLHVPRDMARLNNDFLEVKRYFETHYDCALSVPELLTLFSEIERRVLKKWYVTLANDLYAFIWTGILKRRLAKKGIDVARYISGVTSLESLKPIQSLLNIAKEHGDDENLMQNPTVLEYLETYGDRSPCDLKLEVMTFRENPSLLEQKIREYAGDKEKLSDMIQNLNETKIPPVKNTFILKRARLGIQNREISRLNRSRIYGMVRRIFLAIGEHLHRDGHIGEPSDVFYLEIGEIQAGDTASYRHLIADRKTEYAEYEKLPAHSRLVFRGDTLVDEKTPVYWANGYTGTGVSAGIVTAEAVVLESPDENADVRGKIIVTKTTDPGWVFLLAMAGGIVAEKGSLLSHTAIVSRELRIPAVVAVDNAASVIKTGDIIRINGETGRVEFV